MGTADLERREPEPGGAETDGADPAVVRLALLQCLRAWEPTVRVLGNVRAWDAERAIVDGQNRVAELEQQRDALRAQLDAVERFAAEVANIAESSTQTIDGEWMMTRTNIFNYLIELATRMRDALTPKEEPRRV